MKKFCLAILILAVPVVLPAAVRAQGGARQAPQVVRDADLEKDSLHNLEVARHYFKQKKAYQAALNRCEEIDAGNPTFSKMDEVLYIAGMSSLRLAATGGKQKTKLVLPNDAIAKEVQSSKLKTPEQLRDDARVYFSRLVAGYPNSSYFKQAENELQPLGGPVKLENQ